MRHRDFDDAALTRAGRALARDLGPAEPVLPRPLPRAAGGGGWRLLRRCIGAAAVIALLSILAGERRQAEAEAQAAAVAAAPPWEGVAADRYALEGDEEVRATARRRPSLGLREDSLVAGAFGSIEQPFLRLTLAESPDPEASLFVTLARRAAEHDGLAVLRAGDRGAIESRFGPVETVEATLSGPEGRRACTAFRLLDAGMRLDGWLCAPLGLPPEPAAVGCAIDRLTARPSVLLPAGIVDLLTRPARPVCAPPTPPAAALAPRKGRDRKNAAKVRQSAQALLEPGTTAALGRHPEASR
ncbi:conserved hypothetical protein [Methylobacterium sp. 4-46]|uniref:hypothetical protein n=1 Tax=unclassified Methylobacterium TaxID=2615210 RepID=UPI000152C3CF|nr:MULTISPECIES: hypothetical protein [Methylobacterium]ACA17590.1 conserved hypothetical protein [Methylobacterium sp. 4-46]WFT83266.1 hypothetical protein QA634_16145 [Methylobacterium nodulans]